MGQQNRLQAMDLFPGIDEEIDRRIIHSEMRIKFWVLAGVITNFLIAISAAIPVIWTSASIAADVRAATAANQAVQVELEARRRWTQERMVWEARIESALATQGIKISKEPVPGQGL